jgi:UDP-glucose 4-epimerase
MKNILITGGAGFIGLNLSKRLLEKGHKVFVIDNFKRAIKDDDYKKIRKNKNFTIISADLTKGINQNIAFSHIFHLAATVGVSNVNKSPYETLHNNLVPLFNVINYVKKKKFKSKIIFFSSSEVYSSLIENKKIKFPLTEDNQIMIPNKLIKRDSYFLSKFFGEKIVEMSGLDYVNLRPHNIYGPRMGRAHVIPELIEKINLNHKTVKIFSPNHQRAFCYIDDAIEQIIKLSLDKNINKKTYNIGNMKQEIKIYDLAKKIKKLLNSKSSLKKFHVTPGSPYRRIPSMKKTLNHFKIKNKTKFCSLNEGLLKTIDWYLK